MVPYVTKVVFAMPKCAGHPAADKSARISESPLPKIETEGKSTLTFHMTVFDLNFQGGDLTQNQFIG